VHRPPLLPSTAALLVAGALALTGCGGDDVATPDEVDGGTAVGEVRLEVPEGWEATDDDLPPGVLEARRWRPEAGDLTSLQLVVGCGGSLDELVSGVVRGGRGVVTVTDAVETEALEVPGLDATRGLVLDLEGTVLGGGTRDLRAAGLYGEAGDVLVLLELTQPVEAFDPQLAEEVFASVTVDGDGLASRCEDG
jgi:hypothetical protein